jgi:hypothetical protein
MDRTKGRRLCPPKLSDMLGGLRPDRRLLEEAGLTGGCGEMFKLLGYGATVFAALSMVLWLSYGAQKSTTGAASSNLATMVGPTFSLDTPVEHIAADPRGKMILDRDLPGLLTDRSYVLFEDMSLSQIAAVSGGQLTKADLDLVQADLSQLSAIEKSGQ